MGLGIPEMMLTGAAIGGGVNLLRGKGLGGILQGAALGGAAGGVGGLANNAIQGAGVAGTAGSGVGGSLGAGAAPIASQGAAPFAGAVFNPTTGTWLNPEYYVGATTPFATYTGGEGLLSNATSGLLGKLPDYVTPQNVLGAASIISNTPQQQMPTAPGGGVSAGKPSGLNVSMGNAQLIRRRGQA